MSVAGTYCGQVRRVTSKAIAGRLPFEAKAVPTEKMQFRVAVVSKCAAQSPEARHIFDQVQAVQVSVFLGGLNARIEHHRAFAALPGQSAGSLRVAVVADPGFFAKLGLQAVGGCNIKGE